MDATQASEEVWDGTALNNPANVPCLNWRKADVAAQRVPLQNALILGKIDANHDPFTLRAKDGGDVFLAGLEHLGTAGLGEEQVRRFLAWDPLGPEAAREPSAHWRIAYYLNVHDDGVVDVEAVHVAPDRASHRSRPQPPLPI